MVENESYKGTDIIINPVLQFYICLIFPCLYAGILISWNSYETFFKILGVEVLLAVVVWVILTLVYSGKNKKGADSISSEDEV